MPWTLIELNHKREIIEIMVGKLVERRMESDRLLQNDEDDEKDCCKQELIKLSAVCFVES